MHKRTLLLALSATLAGCVTVPKYEARFDDGLSALQEQFYDHYSAIELDPTGAVCQGPGPHEFWQGTRRKVDLLVVRARYTPDYTAMHDQLTRLRARLDQFETVETTHAATQTAAGRTGRLLCLPDQLARSSYSQLSNQIGSIIQLQLTYKRGGQ